MRLRVQEVVFLIHFGNHTLLLPILMVVLFSYLLGVEEKPDHSLYVTDGLTDAEKMKNDFWNMVNNRQKVSHNIVTNRMKMSTIEPI